MVSLGRAAAFYSQDNRGVDAFLHWEVQLLQESNSGEIFWGVWAHWDFSWWWLSCSGAVPACDSAVLSLTLSSLSHVPSQILVGRVTLHPALALGHGCKWWMEIIPKWNHFRQLWAQQQNHFPQSLLNTCSKWAVSCTEPSVAPAELWLGGGRESSGAQIVEDLLKL